VAYIQILVNVISLLCINGIARSRKKTETDQQIQRERERERSETSVTFLESDMDQQEVQVSHQSTRKSGHSETFYVIEALESVMGKTMVTKSAKVQVSVN
jgi:hypothetical protein